MDCQFDIASCTDLARNLNIDRVVQLTSASSIIVVDEPSL